MRTSSTPSRILTRGFALRFAVVWLLPSYWLSALSARFTTCKNLRQSTRAPLSHDRRPTHSGAPPPNPREAKLAEVDVAVDLITPMSVNLASDSGLAAAVGASAIGGRCYVSCCWRGSQQCCTECAHPLRMFLRLRKRGVCPVRGCTKNVRKQLHRRHNLSERKRALFFMLRYCCCFACAQQSHRRDAAAARPKILSQIAAASQRPATHLSFLSLPSLAGFLDVSADILNAGGSSGSSPSASSTSSTSSTSRR